MKQETIPIGNTFFCHTAPDTPCIFLRSYTTVFGFPLPAGGVCGSGAETPPCQGSRGLVAPFRPLFSLHVYCRSNTFDMARGCYSDHTMSLCLSLHHPFRPPPK